MKLLSAASANTKTRKSQEKAQEFRVVGLALSPAASAGGKSNCPNATPSCINACVGGDNVGLAAVFQSISLARQAKTHWLQRDREGFLKQLKEELQTEQRFAERDGTTLAVRLNTFSDINWFAVIKDFPDAIFYDYTKIYGRVNDLLKPKNYKLCASWTEEPADQTSCLNLLETGHNVAIVFAEHGPFAGNRALSQKLPARWELGGHRYEVYDGDDTDLRFLDPGATKSGYGRICGLRLKAGNNAARLKAMESGFCMIVGGAN